MDFKEIDEILLRNSVVRYNFEILNPINKKEEFAKFQEDNEYNPQFEYKEFDAQPFIDELESLEIPLDSDLGVLFEKIRKSLLAEAYALHHIGTEKYDGSMLFDPVPEYVIKKADEILQQDFDDNPEEKTVRAKDFAKKMRESLDGYGLTDWIVDLNKHAAARASVSAGKKTVTVKKFELFSHTDVNKLLAHEIGTHVIRAVNGRRQEYQIFGIGLPGYLATEEGLAGYNERSQGFVKFSTHKYYALSALITDLCSQFSFVEVYKKVRKYFKEDWDCFKAVARPKRGLGDSARPGGYLKDHCYLEGMLVIEKYVAQGGSLRDLYVGKIGINDLHLLEKGILKPASIIPDFIE